MLMMLLQPVNKLETYPTFHWNIILMLNLFPVTNLG